MLTYSELWSIQEPLLSMAAIIDSWFHFSGKLRIWRRSAADWWYKLQIIRWPEHHVISEKFYDLFCAIYGERTFSLRRFISSFISSIFFLLIAYYLSEAIMCALQDSRDLYMRNYMPDFFSKPFFYKGEVIYKYSMKNMFRIVYDSIGMNFIPDLISICETGVILRIATRKGSSLSKLIVVDLTLTTIIWLIAHLIAYIIFNYDYPMPLLKYIHYYNPFVADASASAFVITTYSTSFIWVLFILFVLILGGLKRMSSLAVRVLESRIVSKIPIVLIVGIPCLISWPILFLLRQILY